MCQRQRAEVTLNEIFTAPWIEWQTRRASCAIAISRDLQGENRNNNNNASDRQMFICKSISARVASCAYGCNTQGAFNILSHFATYLASATFSKLAAPQMVFIVAVSCWCRLAGYCRSECTRHKSGMFRSAAPISVSIENFTFFLHSEITCAISSISLWFVCFEAVIFPPLGLWCWYWICSVKKRHFVVSTRVSAVAPRRLTYFQAFNVLPKHTHQWTAAAAA